MDPITRIAADCRTYALIGRFTACVVGGTVAAFVAAAAVNDGQALVAVLKGQQVPQCAALSLVRPRCY